jgi:hypothetical protein
MRGMRGKRSAKWVHALLDDFRRVKFTGRSAMGGSLAAEVPSVLHTGEEDEFEQELGRIHMELNRMIVSI